MAARVSCIVTSFNNGPWLRQALESLRRQTRRAAEIVVADDGSSDGSRELIRSLAAEDATVRPILRDANVGVAANRDLAIRAAAGDVVTTLDGDDFYYPTKLESELKVFEAANPDAVIYSDVNLVDQDGTLLERLDFDRLAALRGNDLVNYMVMRRGPIPRDMLMTKQKFQEMGGLRHDLALYEDWDLKIRLASSPSDWQRAPGVGMAYRKHGRGLSSADPLCHIEAMLRVIFANRDWLERDLGRSAVLAALARYAPSASAPADEFSAREERPEALVAGAIDAYRRQDFAAASARFTKAMQAAPPAFRHRIELAHSLVLSARWAEVSNLLPPGTNHFMTSGWLNSVCCGRPVDAKGLPIPWYTYPAIEFIERVAPPDANVFEWGAGQSTLWWSRRAGRVVSVEHDAAWHATVRASLPPQVELFHLASEPSYSEQIKQYPKHSFNVVVIDGQWRNECALLAAEYAHPSAIIIFDNSDRRAFAAGMTHLGRNGWRRIDFFGGIPSYLYKNCTSVFFKDEGMLQRSGLPYEQVSCLGPTCAQSLGQ